MDRIYIDKETGEVINPALVEEYEQLTFEELMEAISTTEDIPHTPTLDDILDEHYNNVIEASEGYSKVSVQDLEEVAVQDLKEVTVQDIEE